MSEYKNIFTFFSAIFVFVNNVQGQENATTVVTSTTTSTTTSTESTTIQTTPITTSPPDQNKSGHLFPRGLLDHLPGSIQDVAQDQLASAISLTFRWAENHFPLTVKLLQLAKSVGDANLDKIPGAKAFLDILSETFMWHMTKAKLAKHNLTSTDFRKKSIEETIEEFQKHHNYSVSDIPLVKNLTKEFLYLPAMKDLAKQAMLFQVEGIPFAITLLELMDHLAAEVPVVKLGDSSTWSEIHKNVSRIFTPFIKHESQRQLDMFKENSLNYVSNVSELNFAHFIKASQVVNNLTENFIQGWDVMAQTLEGISKSILNRTKMLHEENVVMAREVSKDLQEHMVSAGKMDAARLFPDPIGVADDLSLKARNFTRNTFDKVTNFTTRVAKHSWSLFGDFAPGFADRARNFTSFTLKNFYRLGQGLIEHTFSSLKNLTEITKQSSPLKVFRSKKAHEAAENNSTVSFLDSIPLINSIPGVSWVNSFLQSILKHFKLNF